MKGEKGGELGEDRLIIKRKLLGYGIGREGG